MEPLAGPNRSFAAGMWVLLAAGITALLLSPSADARRYSSGVPAQMKPTIAESAPSAGNVAAAAVDLTPCDEHPDRLCGEVDVPLDRANPAGGTIPIHFEVYPHTAPGPTDRAIFVTEGGPGSSITRNPFFGDFLRGLFDPLMEHRDLVLIDQRGVGLSQAIDCQPLQNLTDDTLIYDAVAACGAQLGDTAALYGSVDVAKDIEAVREALGIEHLDLYGGSYAAQDFQAYSVRFPDHIRSIVLDSPFTSLGYDTFFETTAEAAVRTIRLICKRSETCSADHRDAVDELEWLAKRLRKRPIDGVGFDADGVQHTVHITEAFLANKLATSDAGGYLAPSELAAAAEALREEGDRVPLLRLAAENDFPFFVGEPDPTSFSAGDNWARFCTDAKFPWRKSASIEQRHAQYEDEVEDLDRDEFDPFSIDAWLAPPPDGVSPEPCIVWPAPDRKLEAPVPARGDYPDAPTLVLSGDLDSVTTSADARRVAALFPDSRFLEVANSGHHTALNFRSDCVGPIVVSFIAEFSPGDTSCTRSNEFVVPARGRFPEEADDARPATGTKSRKHRSKKRTDKRVAQVAAVSANTVIDAVKRSFIQSGPEGVGLRGGTFTIEFSDTAATLQLDGARFAEDVAVTGTAVHSFETDLFDVNVTVDGPRDLDGTLNITGLAFFVDGASTWQINGELGGRTVNLRVPVT